MEVKADKLNKDAKKPKESERDLFVTCFTDGSLCHQSGAWGIAFWVKYGMSDKPVMKWEGGKGEPRELNSTVVERMALEKAKSYILKNYNIEGKVLVIQSDSLPAINGFSTKEFKKAGAKHVKMKHVKAHTSNNTNRTTVNDMVDRKARKAMREYRD